MLRIIVEFLTKVGLYVKIKLVKLLQQEQRLILDEFRCSDLLPVD